MTKWILTTSFSKNPELFNVHVRVIFLRETLEQSFLPNTVIFADHLRHLKKEF